MKNFRISLGQIQSTDFGQTKKSKYTFCVQFKIKMTHFGPSTFLLYITGKLIWLSVFNCQLKVSKTLPSRSVTMLINVIKCTLRFKNKTSIKYGLQKSTRFSRNFLHKCIEVKQILVKCENITDNIFLHYYTKLLFP